MEGRLNMVGFMTLLVLGVMVHGSLAQTTHVVGDSLSWLVPPGGEIAYSTWVASRTFRVGDRLVFNFTTGQHDVAEVSRASFDSCNSSSTISLSTNGPTTITLNSSGDHYFICTFSSHCDLGQKLAINVSSAAASPTPSPQPATSPPEAAPSPAVGAPSPSRVGMTYTVGDGLGWLVPPGGPIAYQTWARGRSFVVGDVLLFNFTNGAHDVVEVTRAEFDSCNITTTTTTPITTSPARVPLTSAGEHYYICNFPQHCSFGQKLAINVTAGSGPSAAPAQPPSSTATPPSGSAQPPSSTATPPSGSAPPPSSTATPPPNSRFPTPATPFTPSTPSPINAPPPPSNSAPSFAVAALPFTFLAVAFAFLYN